MGVFILVFELYHENSVHLSLISTDFLEVRMMKKLAKFQAIVILIIITTSFYSLLEFSNETMENKSAILPENPQLSFYDLKSESVTNSSITLESTLQRNYIKNDVIDENEHSISIQQIDNLDVDSQFVFSEIKSEKIINGNAETTEELWTEYLPSNYEGNVTREDNPDIGSVINGNYSWYYNISSQDYTTIVGFDTSLTFSSHSVIFNFSYSLLQNSLDFNKDSNIFIRLSFQFDIYLFIWFNGNPGALTNVTGPGGYADILINQADFDSEIHSYSLNITKIGVELFNQEPDQLRGFVVQTWGEDPYQMKFLLDDISLTDETSPEEINLKINNINVEGEVGSGFLALYNYNQTSIEFIFEYTYSNIVFWKCEYLIICKGSSKSITTVEFINWDILSWKEEYNNSFSFPIGITEAQIEKIIPKLWVIEKITVDSLNVPYNILDFNSTHNKIDFIINNFSLLINLNFIIENYLNELYTSNQFITHDDQFNVSVESDIINKEIQFSILNYNIEIYSNNTNTDLLGSALICFSKIESYYERCNYSMIIYWVDNYRIGLGFTWFELTTKPTSILSTNKIEINYHETINLNLNYICLETTQTIDTADLNYIWEFGFGILQQDYYGNYTAQINTQNIAPGNYIIKILGSKEGFATCEIYIPILIVFSNINLNLIAPSVALPGERIRITAELFDNNSNPIINTRLRFLANNQFILETFTNESGMSDIYYQILNTYSESTLNISCQVLINEIIYLNYEKTILVDLLELHRLVTLDTPTQIESNYIAKEVIIGFSIDYQTFGERWYCNIPIGYEPISAVIMSDNGNITAEISTFGKIYWNKNVLNPENEFDMLLLQITYPDLTYTTISKRNEIILNITITNNNIPFTNLEMRIANQESWSIYDKWSIFLDDENVTASLKLQINNEYFSFYIITSDEMVSVNYQLVGYKEKLVVITPSTIILGIGITSFTIMTTTLVFKKKKEFSFDIQT